MFSIEFKYTKCNLILLYTSYYLSFSIFYQCNNEFLLSLNAINEINSIQLNGIYTVQKKKKMTKAQGKFPLEL